MNPNNNFKQQMRLMVNEYLDIDNQILTLTKAIKERRNRKEKLSKVILETMKNNEIEQMNINNEKLVYSVTESKTPLNKAYLNNVLFNYFNDSDKTSEVIDHILNNRTKVEKVKLKRLNQKKKRIELE
jgi:hypothetical protein